MSSYPLYEYQLTNKAKILNTLSQLLKSDTDCVLHLYKVLQGVEYEENKKYHTNNLIRLLFSPSDEVRVASWTRRSFPINRNISEWGIKINKLIGRMDHLDMIRMIGGTSKECESPFHRFIVNIKQQDWINNTLLHGDTLRVNDEPPPPILKEKVKTLDYKVAVDGTDERLYEVFGSYHIEKWSQESLPIPLVVEVEFIRYHSTRHHVRCSPV